MKRFFNCFKKEKSPIVTINPIREAHRFPPHLEKLPDTLPELLYLETVIHMNLKTFNQEASLLSDKAHVLIARGDVYRGMFILRQRRYVVEESSKLLQVLDDVKQKKQILMDFPAEFRAAQKIKF